MTFFCSIEHTSQCQLQWLVTIPGVFHIWMAVVDAIWRIHIRGEALCSNEGGTYKLFEYLHPRDSTKLGTNPTYRMLNDGIQHLIKQHLIVCWRMSWANWTYMILLGGSHLGMKSKTFLKRYLMNNSWGQTLNICENFLMPNAT